MTKPPNHAAFDLVVEIHRINHAAHFACNINLIEPDTPFRRRDLDHFGCRYTERQRERQTAPAPFRQRVAPVRHLAHRFQHPPRRLMPAKSQTLVQRVRPRRVDQLVQKTLMQEPIARRPHRPP